MSNSNCGGGGISHGIHSISAKKNVAVNDLIQGKYKFDANKIYIFYKRCLPLVAIFALRVINSY